MNWAGLDVIPHLGHLQEETACLWQALFAQRGMLVPHSLLEWKGTLDAAPRGLPATIFVDLPPDEAYQLQRVYGFPQLDMPLLPQEPELSQVIADALDTPIPGLLRQSQIAAEIEHSAPGNQIVVLLVLDGLAYEDVVGWQYPAEWQRMRRPCLVDGVTLTQLAMPRAIGSPPVAHRLFPKGFKQHLGFTYWERESNALTDTLFAEFSKTQLTRVSEFDQILDCLADWNFNAPTFVQIVRDGLDQFVHSYRERPDIGSFLRELERSIARLLDLLATFHQRVRVYITADHGILWYQQHDIVPVAGNVQSARYVAGDVQINSNSVVRISEEAGNYSVIVGPQHIYRNRRNNEWGFHGGISGRESLVPFVTLDYRP